MLFITMYKRYCSRFSRVLFKMECQASLLNCHRTDIQESLRHVVPPEIQVVPVPTRTVPLGPVDRILTDSELRLLVIKYSAHPVMLLNFQLDGPNGKIYCHVSHMDSLLSITIATVTGTMVDNTATQQKLSALSFEIPVTQRSLIFNIPSVPASFWFHDSWMRFCSQNRDDYATFLEARPDLLQTLNRATPPPNQVAPVRPSVPAPSGNTGLHNTGATGYQHPGQFNLLYSQPRPQTSHPFSTPLSRNMDSARPVPMPNIRLDYSQADRPDGSSTQQPLPKTALGSRESCQAANIDVLCDLGILVNPTVFKEELFKQLGGKSVSTKYHSILMLLIHGLAEFVPIEEIAEKDTKTLLFSRNTPDEEDNGKDIDNNGLDKDNEKQ